MPKKAVDYSKTVIYKIVCNDLEIKDIYVGSTSNFRNRKYGRKTSCCNDKDKHYNLKVYTTIRANGGFDNWIMLEIEKYPCQDGDEARARERFWYEELEAKMNTLSPTLNVEKRKEYFKKYAEEHREERKKYEAEHREKRNQQERERYAKKKAEKILISPV